MHQFHIERLIPLEVNGVDVSISAASVAMIGASAVAVWFMSSAMKPAALVPGRTQLVAENFFSFIRGMVKDATGAEGVAKFFPFVFSLFIFIFMANMIGMFPYFFTSTGQLVVPALMALLVFFTVIVIGFAKNGLKFFKLFAPSGVPLVILPFVVLIELISFFSRPISHSVRLWANIFAGHILLKVFAGFVPAMASVGGLGILGSVLPLAMTVGLYGLEFLVAALQAYVFALLTCIYLNDALHPGH